MDNFSTIHMLKSKIHGVNVTQAEIDYEGSVTIDENWIEQANLFIHEQVHILNKNNGERFITYVIKGQRGSGVICINGPAALKAKVGDVIIILSYASVPLDQARKYQPTILLPHQLKK